LLWRRKTGLSLRIAGPAPAAARIERAITDEAAISALAGQELRVTPLVAEGDLVAQGAPVLELRHQPRIRMTAPMPGRVASIDLGPGRRLSEIRFFLEHDAGRHQHDVTAADGSPGALRALMLEAGLWPSLRSRPFGRLPGPDERPAAIFVMAIDTRPLAPDPILALADREEAFGRGVAALAALTEGPVYVCQPEGAKMPPWPRTDGRVRALRLSPVHPQGLPGLAIHATHPAAIDRPVWDVHAEDVAALGSLLQTGLVPEDRLVSVAGPALEGTRLVRCQPGADLRSLTYGHVRPGPHRILSGSPLEGRMARWLGARDRQVSVLGPDDGDPANHWLMSALRGASRPLPTIPTAAVDQALGGALPAIPLLRAIAVGDRETAVRLGLLSLLAEDLALADYVTAAEPRHSSLLSALLAGIAEEEAA
jgi:Na+-transporting NADH:ubiquinone oxidoreductase subunit A